MSDSPHPKHDHATLIFPDNFLWGAATSAHQVEGNNINSDWWEWEKSGKLKKGSGDPTPPSGKTADQYHLYEQDFTLAKSLNHNAHRLSLEWSRIEPEEGIFNQDAIDHYREVLKTLKGQNFTVMLTLHHFTLPLWVSKKGGWENGKTVWYFERFVKKIVPEYKDLVDLWITINEPSVLALGGYIEVNWPPQKKSKFLTLKVFWNLAQAHKKAYWAIHKEIPSSKVGIANNIASFNSLHNHSLREIIGTWAADILGNHSFYFLSGIKTHDFLGLNYYFNWYINLDKKRSFWPNRLEVSQTRKEVSDLGWEIHPDGIFDVLVDFSDYHLPIYITENGTATNNDDRRVRFLISYLKEIYHATKFGADVRGYFHWSLIDNFEWSDGFDPKFGLIEVDFETLKRTPRPSSLVYQEIIKNNGISHKLLKLLGHGIKVEDVI